MPPLRERPEDIEALKKHFLARAGRELTFTDGAERAFLRYRWPGNVRELLNVVEQLTWLSTTRRRRRGPSAGLDAQRTGPDDAARRSTPAGR